MKNVTEDFCDWIKNLGGEHNIDPATLTSLFASGYDTKPPLSVPIHVVELSNIPAELRPTAYAPPPATAPHLSNKHSQQLSANQRKIFRGNNFDYLDNENNSENEADYVILYFGPKPKREMRVLLFFFL